METPFFILDRKRLHKNFVSFSRLLGKYFHSDVEPFYSTKTNNHHSVLQEVMMNGYNLEVSSKKEISVAVKYGFQKILYNAPVKTWDDLNYALKNNVSFISCESLREISILDKLAASYKKKQNILLRVDTRCNSHASNQIIHLFSKRIYSKKSKFGINYEELSSFLKRLNGFPNLIFKGINIHMGSQIIYPDIFSVALSRIPKDVFESCEVIDIGGGFPCPTIKRKSGFFKEILGKFEPEYSIDEYMQRLANHTNETLSNKTIFFEPGRSIVNSCIHAFFSIGKISGNRIYLDGGLNMIPYHLFRFKYNVGLIRCKNMPKKVDSNFLKAINKNRVHNTKKKYDIYGNMCFENDVIAENVALANPREGDIMVFYNCGAYSLSMEFRFNQPKVPVYEVK